MGVRGLSKFFDMNPELSKPHRLHDTKVILDGNNILHMLYFNYRVECTYGGDYHRFASVVKKYFMPYLKCNIMPIVIFDGGYDKSDKKLRTTIKRAKHRLSLTKFIERHGSCSVKVLPILAMEMFKDVIHEIGITYAQCDFEADDQITAIANHYKCPVISQDSDFYIFDIPSGFVRFDSVDSTCYADTNSEGKKYQYLNCKIYFIDNFLSFFPGIDKKCLPLFGTLIGNDYVDISTFESFFMNIRLPKFKSKSLKVNKQQQRMMGLLAWLKHYSLHDGIEKVLSHLKQKQRENVKELIERIMSSYDIQVSKLIDYLDSTKSENVECQNSVVSKLSSFCGNPLPLWFVEKFRQGRLSPFLLNVVGLHRVFLPSQIEDTNVCSSYNSCLSIRKVLYGLLLSFDNFLPNPNHVEEYNRQRGSTLQKICVQPIGFLEGFGKLPELSELHNLDSLLRKNVILSTLEEDINYFKDVPDFLQLLLICIRFWIRKSEPKPTISFYNALVLSIIFLAIAEPLLPGDLNPKDYESHCKSSFVQHPKSESLVDIINEVSLPNASFFAKSIKKYFQKPVHNHAKPIFLSIVHSFSQLQGCLLFLLYLNKLLGSPFLNPRIHTIFSGTLLYNMARELMSRPFQDLFISETVGRSSVLDHLFLKLRSKILENFTADCLQSDDPHLIVRKRKKKNLNVSQIQIVSISDDAKEDEMHDIDAKEDEMLDISNKFSCLNTRLGDSDPTEVFL